jgi:RND superfamily putative drug exporter
MIRLGTANIARPKFTVWAWIVITVLLAVSSIGIQDRLSQPTFLVRGYSSEEAFTVQAEHFGVGTKFAVMLEGEPEELRRQGLEVTRALERAPDYQVLSPFVNRNTGDLRPDPRTAVIAVTASPPVKDNYRLRTLDLARDVDTIVHKHTEKGVRVSITGPATVGVGLEEAALKATTIAEIIAAPLLMTVLLFVFRSVWAAAVPLVFGGASVAAGFGVLGLLAPVVPINALATTFASLLGLALGVDYSLLMVSRFREELERGLDSAAAAAEATRTAGRTVIAAGALLAFGMAVSVVVLPPGVLFSAAVGALVTTMVSLTIALLVLPAVLALMGPNINKWPVGRKRREGTPRGLLGRVLSRRPAPLIAVVPVIVVLLLIALPATNLEAHAPGPELLPADNRQRQEYLRVVDKLGPGWGAPFELVVVADRGSVAKQDLLERMRVAQRRVSRDKGVEFVAGAGSLAKPLAKLDELPKGIDRLGGELARGKRSLAKLDGGLGEAGTGAGQLQHGLRLLRDAGVKLRNGELTAAEGAAQLERGLQAAAEGARQLEAGLRRAKAGAEELESGSAEAASGARRLTDGLQRTQTAVEEGAAQARAFPPGLRQGGEDLGRLREPVQIAQAQLDEALRKLDAMTLGKADPQYLELYRAVATAQGAVTGRNPLTGEQVREDYRGLDTELQGAQGQLVAAAGQADQIVDGLDRLGSALVQLRNGSERLTAGIDKLQAGADELDKGLAALTGGSAELADGVELLASGAGQLTPGLNRLSDGAAQLAEGLQRGFTGSSELRLGIDTIGDRVGEYGDTLPSTKGFDRLDKQSPGLFESGYFRMAALDGAPAKRRKEAAFAIDIDGGGQAAKMIVLPTTPVIDPRTEQLRDRLEDTAAFIQKGGQAHAHVGGEGAEEMDYRDASLSRLALLVVLLTVSSYILLVLILRSLVLPLIAVVLNLLTIAATLGVLELVFQGDPPLFGGPGYIDVLSLVGTFAVTSALSIDYEVFLLTRMREGYQQSGSTEEAIHYGLEHTARVITGAAAIMLAVFAAFAATNFITIRELGVGLGVAIAVDATLVRLILLPALMRACGRANWWLPGWLDRHLPELALEAKPAAALATTATGHPAYDGNDPYRTAPQPSPDRSNR